MKKEICDDVKEVIKLNILIIDVQIIEILLYVKFYIVYNIWQTDTFS